MPTITNGPGAVQTAYVSYRQVSLTDNLTLFWPNAFQATPNVMAAYMEFSTVSAPNLTVTLPDARQVSVGQNFIISNTSAEPSFDLLRSDGSVLATITNGSIPGTPNTFYFILTSNTTEGFEAAGVWTQVDFGATTGAAAAAALAGYGLIVGSMVGFTGRLWTNAATQEVPTAGPDFDVTDGSFNGSTLVWTGGTGDLYINGTGDGVQNGFFFYLNTYEATGPVTITPAFDFGTIDGAATKVINPRQSLMVVYRGLGDEDEPLWCTIGYSPATTATFSIKAVNTTGGDTNISAPDAAYNLFYVTGNLASNAKLIFPSGLNTEWQIQNATTPGGNTLSIEISGNAGSNKVIPEGKSSIYLAYNNDLLPVPSTAGTVSQVAVTSSDVNISVTGSPITSSGTITLTLNTVPLNKGGTGQTTQSAALNALMPPGAAVGDMLYYNSLGNWQLLPVGTAVEGNVLKLVDVGGDLVPVWQAS